MSSLENKVRNRFAVAVLPIFACVFPLLGQLSLNITPTQLTFNSQTGVAQNLVIVSSNGSPTTYTITSNSSGGNWISVSPQTGTTPQVVTVSVSPGALGTGTYAGYILVSSASGTSTVPVTLNVNGSGVPAVVATPGVLNFSFPIGSATAQTQQVNIASTGNPFTYTATTSTSTGANYLTLSQTSGQTGGTLGVTVNPANLTSGLYFGAVAINAPGSTGAVIPIYVNVAVSSAINIYPQQLAFSYQTGTTAPAPQTLIMTTTQGGPLNFTTNVDTSACIGKWLTVTPTAGSAPGTMSVQIDPTGLQPGSCPGTIYILAPGAVNPTITIPVVLTISSTPILQLPAVGPTINYQTGAATPTPPMILVTSTSTPVNFTVQANPSPGGPNFLTASPTSGTTPQALTLALNPTVLSGLTPNTYAENVTVASADGSYQQTFTVVLVVSNNPFLSTTQQSVNFNYQIGQTSPLPQNLGLLSSGAALAYSVFPSTTNCPGFLTATPSSGTTALTSGTQSQVAVGVTTTGLTTPQTCSGTLIITTPGSATVPITIPVTLNVSSNAVLNPSSGAINLTVAAGAMAQAMVALASTDGTTALNYSVATSPGASWLSATPGTGSVPATLTIVADGTKLTAGVYTGSISVSSTTANVPTQTILVTLTVH